jgi:copper(I)-binding protein
VALSLLASASAAGDFSAGDVEIGNPWARATPKGASVAGAYMSITNKGSTPDRLISGSTPVASRFEVHTMVIEDGIAKMRPVEGGLEIKPHQTVELKPGAYHVMLTGLTQPLQQGERVPGTLVFERAGKVDVEFTVVPIGQNAPAAGDGHHPGH